MIEPSSATSIEPVIDELTRKMAAAWRKRAVSDLTWRGFHTCKCGARSDCKDHWVKVDGKELITNSLAIHYLAYHRDEVPQSELDKVALLDYGQEEPTEEQLIGL